MNKASIEYPIIQRPDGPRRFPDQTDLGSRVHRIGDLHRETQQ